MSAGWGGMKHSPVRDGLVGHGRFASHGDPRQLLEWQAGVKALHFILKHSYTGKKEIISLRARCYVHKDMRTKVYKPDCELPVEAGV